MMRRARCVAAAEFAVIVLVVWTRFVGFTEHVDLHAADEIVYYLAGVDLFAHGTMPSLAWGPLYSFAYGCLALFPIDGHLPDTMLMLSAGFGSLALWWALRAVAPSPLAVVAATWYAASPIILQASAEGPVPGPGVYAFNAIFVFLSFGAMARGRVWLAIGMLCLVSLGRAENLPWLLAFAMCAVLLPSMRARRRSSLGMLALAVAVAAMVAASPDHRDRAWLAFRQSYGQQACLQELAEEWVRLEGKVDPERARFVPFELQAAFDVPDRWIERDFPGARSVLDALQSNPEPVLAMVSRNLTVLPFALEYTWSTTFLPRPWSSRVLALATLLAIGGLWQRRRVAGLPPTDVRSLLPWYLATSVLVLGVPLFVAARPELGLATIPLLAWILCRGLASLAPVFWQRPAIAPSTIAVVVALLVAVPGPFRGPALPMPYRDGLALLKEHLPPGEVRLLSAFWDLLMRMVPRTDVVLCPQVASGLPTFAACADACGANAVLVTMQFEHQTAQCSDRLTSLQAPPWRLVAQRGEARLYLR